MAAHLRATSALLIFQLMCALQSSLSQDTNNCEKGWFGPHCQYKCRCKDNFCEADGTCARGSKCEKGWFGPACQYYNLIAVGGTVFPSNIYEITDNDDKTCSPSNLEMISVKWNQSYLFSWLRLHIRKSESAPNINITLFNRGSPVNCSDTTLSEQTDVTYDFHCSPTVAVTRVVIKGDVVPDLCSLYISGGRNVALKQPTDQSSTYVDSYYNVTFNSSRSENAVDGNPSGDFNKHSCTQTQEGKIPHWLTDFRSPKLVNRYVVYNRNVISERLVGFKLHSYDDNGTKIFEHKFTTKNMLYNIMDPVSDHIVKIIVILKESQAILTLCELEAYGDSVCQAGRYGRDCQHECNCFSKTESCFVSTGACPSGCAAGYYGEGCQSVNNCTAGSYGANCDKSCPKMCQGKTCSKESGFCSGCESGWQGLTCDKACDFGTYGKGCKKLCSFKCRSIECDPVNGACVGGCDKGYKLPDCFEECDSGYYGYNCTQVCSKNCQDETCEISEGKCHLGCLPGYQADQCDKECDTTFYGQNCSQICSSACENRECIHTSGVCKDCPAGKIGDQCDTTSLEEGDNFVVYVGVGASAGGIIIVVIVIIIIIRKRTTHKASVKRSRNDNTELSLVQTTHHMVSAVRHKSIQTTDHMVREVRHKLIQTTDPTDSEVRHKLIQTTDHMDGAGYIIMGADPGYITPVSREEFYENSFNLDPVSPRTDYKATHKASVKQSRNDNAELNLVQTADHMASEVRHKLIQTTDHMDSAGYIIMGADPGYITPISREEFYRNSFNLDPVSPQTDLLLAAIGDGHRNVTTLDPSERNMHFETTQEQTAMICGKTPLMEQIKEEEVQYETVD